MGSNSRINMKSGVTPSHQGHRRSCVGKNALQMFDLLIKCFFFFSTQAIQDITRTYDIPPEDIVTLIYEKIDVHGEGEEHQIGDCDVSLLVNTVFNLSALPPGELTLEEFISGAREHPDIMEMLTKMMDLTHVLEIIVSGQQKKAIKWATDTFVRGWGGLDYGWRSGSRLSPPLQELYCTWLRGPVQDWPLPRRKQRNRPLLSAWAPAVLKTFNNGSSSSGDRQRGVDPIGFQLEMDDQKWGIPW